jgi:ATP-dependent helicase/nuclease subunit A
MSGDVHPLGGNQRGAVDPRDSVWLSASAGTGKTQVLSARVLRLLLEPGTDPSDILCLTFTKAGAAEMAVRVNQVLARWVRLNDGDLGRELSHVGAPVTSEVRDCARSLFARVLDCPGGGLRIDTIHAFAQWLLGAFPGEAGILPGMRAMEDRERALLADEVLARLIAEADVPTLAAIREMSIRKGPDGVRRWLMRCAAALELWEGPGGWQPPMRERACRLLGLASDADQASLAALCADEQFDTVSLRQCLEGYQGWKATTGADAVTVIGEWLSSAEAGRYAGLDGLNDALFFKNGNPKLPKNADPVFAAASARVGQVLAAIREQQTLIALADFLAPQLEAGRRFALMWDEAKAREGLVDFDDLIRRAASLLSNKAMADWIRYKLDRQFDHILIDEAQDTNAAQWTIIEALTDDFFSGEGARGSRIRTIFTVGDVKQAIFGFQGTSPKNFIAARDRVAARMLGLVEADPDRRERRNRRPLQDLDLGQSFRTADIVLRFVDHAIAAIGPERFGVDRAPEHIGEGRPGLVAQWGLVIDGSTTAEDETDAARSDWLARHDRLLADKIARQVRRWMDHGFPLVKGKSRRAGPGDVMVLVRKRRELAALIVARLHTYGVPVAGVDRLRLGAPLAVKDLMAALRFAVQPLDDLNLACLLVSPLGGWTQEELLTHGYRPTGKRLWQHLRDNADPRVTETVESLRAIMARADFDSPQALLHWILTGPLDGRRKLVARLGREANDPIDELLNAANAFASAHIASLHGFIRWFDAGEGELKREGGAAQGQVRVMTVHGSKGLQAPIVILADAAIGPDSPDELELSEPFSDGMPGPLVPIPALPKDQRAGPLANAHAAATAEAMEEHWRLLYVAMTRAEEALFIAGSLGPRDTAKGIAPEDSWYARLLPLFDSEPLEDDIWGVRREWGALAKLPETEAKPLLDTEISLPGWLMSPAPQEARPPRPLAPSGLGGEEGSDPPFPPELSVDAARRGVLIHALLERLPAVPPSERTSRATSWLARQAPELDTADCEELLAISRAVLATPEFAELFGPDALAEVPLAAVVGGQVIAGTADRMLVTDDTVTVLDFKTARRPPATLADVPEATLRQMAAYVAALEAIFPDREVRAAVLYTQTPLLIALPPELMARCKARFDAGQESFAPTAR